MVHIVSQFGIFIIFVGEGNFCTGITKAITPRAAKRYKTEIKETISKNDYIDGQFPSTTSSLEFNHI